MNSAISSGQIVNQSAFDAQLSYMLLDFFLDRTGAYRLNSETSPKMDTELCHISVSFCLFLVSVFIVFLFFTKAVQYEVKYR